MGLCNLPKNSNLNCIDKKFNSNYYKKNGDRETREDRVDPFAEE
jgi:hypothetical protein